MSSVELQSQVRELLARPLSLVCRTPNSTERAMSLEECLQSGGVYVHVAFDELDKLLDRELGMNENRRKQQKK